MHENMNTLSSSFCIFGHCRSYELTRKDRVYKNIEKMQHLKGLKNFDFIPQTFVMPTDFRDLCSAHYRQRGPWIVKPVASSRGRGIFIVSTVSQMKYLT
jgi:tubulin polyglutamylase TTLL5